MNEHVTMTLVCRGMREGGGIQTVVAEIARQHAAQPGNGRLIVMSDDFDDGFRHLPGVTLVKVWSPAKWLKFLPRYGMVMIAQPFFLLTATIRIAIYRRKFGVVFNHGSFQTLCQDVVVFHSCHQEWVNEKRKTSALRGYFSPLDVMLLACERWNARKSAHRRITAVSEMTRQQVERLLAATDVEVVPNGVDTERFSGGVDDRQKSRAELQLLEDDIILLFVANEWKRKGLEHLARAFSLLQDEYPACKLLLAGRNLGSGWAYCKDKYKLGDRFIHLGQRKRIEDVYRAADLFCVPSGEDAFGLVYGEAMSCGLPVVMTDRCGIKSYIRHGENGMVVECADMERQLYRCLKWLLDNPLQRREIGRRAAETARAQLSWEAVSRRYMELAVELAEEQAEEQAERRDDKRSGKQYARETG